MKRFILSLLLLAQPCAWAAAPTFVGCASNSTTSGTSLTTSYAPTAGNTLIIGAITVNNVNTGVTLSDASSWTADQSIYTNTNVRIQLGHYFNVPAGITGATLSAASGTYMELIVCEQGPSAVDVVSSTGANSSAGSVTTPSVTTTDAADMCWGLTGIQAPNPATVTNATYTIPTNAKRFQQYYLGGAMAYLVTSSTGAQSTTFVYGDTGHAAAATIGCYKSPTAASFKPQAGAFLVGP